MVATIIMPQLGETVAEGKILAWFKSVGDEIREGDNLFEVETDKVTIEVQAVIAGRLSEVRVGPGSTARVGEVVAVVAAAAASGCTKTDAPTPRAAHWRSPFDEVSTSTDRFGTAKGPNGVLFTPLARRLISQHRLDPITLAADAHQRGAKRVDEAAVRVAIEARPAFHARQPAPIATPRSPATASVHEGGVVTLNTVQERTGERLAENWRTIPHVFQAIEVDFTAVDGARKKHKEPVQDAHGVSLTYLPFIARAVCLAVAAFPLVNARFEGKVLRLSRAVNLGIAVDLNHDGLIVPVVRDAGDLTLIGLAKAIRRQVDKAMEGKLFPEDLSGGTYSISNNGAFGTTLTVPIINAPQVGILSTDAIQLKPAVVSTKDGDFVVPRMIGMVGQSFDHRAFDGAYSAAFLSRLREVLEGRNWDEEFPTF